MAHCQQAIETDRELGDLISLAKDLLNQSVIAWDLGNWRLSAEANRQAIELLERTGEKRHLAINCCNLADTYRDLGELEAGIAYARRGLRVFEQIGSTDGIVFACTVLGSLFWRQGDLELAQMQLSKARGLADAHDAVEFKPALGRWFARVYVSSGDVAMAEAEIQALSSLGMDLGTEVEPIQRLWGQVLAMQGKWDNAVQVLQASLARSEQESTPHEIAYTQLALARVLSREGGDPERASTHANRAHHTFITLGAELDAREAAILIAELGV